MPIYTGVADVNGDFTVPFSSNYTGGQKITVTAEKDSATKTIELFAPSEVTGGGGGIQIGGDMTNFPNNIGNVIFGLDVAGTIPASSFADSGSYYSIWGNAKGLIINGPVTTIKNDAFKNWGVATLLILPSSITRIENSAFYGWSKLEEIIIPDLVTYIGDTSFGYAYDCKRLTIGSSVTYIGISAFSYMLSCDEIIFLANTPPAISTNTFANLKSTCVIKVPASSLTAYQTSGNWPSYASRIQAM